jgi:membrane-bound serine protease (ClpP class)
VSLPPRSSDPFGLLAAIAQITPNAPAPTAEGGSDAYLVASLVLGLVGLLILAIELFIPTGGLLAILCAVSFIASVVAMFMWSTPAGVFLLFAYVIAAPFALVFFLKLWAKSPLVRRYALRDPERMTVVSANGESLAGGAASGISIDPEDPDAAQAASDDARRRRHRELAGLVGQHGIVETPLRPIGFIRIGEQRLDASAETGLIDAGTPVRVIAVVDGTLKVRAEG